MLEPVMSGVSRRDTEGALYEAYRKSRSMPDKQALIASFQNLIQNEVNRWTASGLPRLALEGEATHLAIQAIETYNPTAGTQLATHMTNTLRRLSRYVAANQHTVRLSEANQLAAYGLHNDKLRLETELGRPPTPAELSLATGQTTTTLAKWKNWHEHLTSKVQEGTGMPVREDISRNQIIMDFLHHDLPVQHRLVFAHSVGYKGAEQLTPGQIAQKLNLSPSRISQIRGDIAQRLQKYMVADQIITS